MSLTHEQNSAPPMAPRRSFARFLLVPFLIVLIFGGIFAIPWICVALGISLEGYAMPSMMTQTFAPALALLLLAVWWLFFSGISWLTRIGVVFVVGAACTAFAYSVRSFELTTGTVALVPLIQFVWDPIPEPAKRFADESAADAKVGPEDFPCYRGSKRDGIITFIKLNPSAKPTELWRHGCKGGYGGVAVAGNIAVTMEQRGPQETVVCYDRRTGHERWAYAYDAYHKDIMGDGPRATPAIHDNRIFTIGATGEIRCLTPEGKELWKNNVLTLALAKNIQWGLTGSPLIVNDLVIANAGHDPETSIESSLIAFEQVSGKIRWQTGQRKAGYSSPQLAVLAGVPQILLFDGAGLAGFDPKTGKELWQYPWITDWDMNSIQPVVVGSDSVFISSEVANGGALLRVKPPADDQPAWSVDRVWKTKRLAARYANPVTDGKQIYGLHSVDGMLTCLNVSDGSVKWKGDRMGPGQLLLVDDMLLVTDSNKDKGDVVLLDADTGKERSRVHLFDKKTWNTPALAGDQLFVRNQYEIVCLKLARR